MSLVGHIATDAKCVKIVFKVCEVTILRKMSVCAISHNPPEFGDNEKLCHQCKAVLMVYADV